MMPTTPSKTISDVKNQIITVFKNFIKNEAVYPLMESRVNAYGAFPFLFSDSDPMAENNQISAVIASYVFAFEIETEYFNKIMQDNAVTRSSKVNHTHGHVITAVRDDNDVTTFVDGGDTTLNIAYPSGYDGTSDTAYKDSEQRRTSPENDVTTIKGDGTDTTTNSGTDTNTSEDFDLTVWREALTDTTRFNFVRYCDDILYKLIDSVEIKSEDSCSWL